MTDPDSEEVAAAPPSPEALAADLATMLRTGVTVDRCRSAASVLGLELVRAKATTENIDDLAVSAGNLIREACAVVDGIDTGGIAVLLGLAPGWRGRLLKDRRTAAAGRLSYSVEHLRKDREPLLLEAVADELYAMDSAYRLRHRHRIEAEREPNSSRLGIDWLEQHRSYRRIWTPVTAMRNDLLVLVDYLHDIRANGQVPKPPGQIDAASDEQPVDADTWADLSDRCANLTWRLGQYSREVETFIEREGGLWLLADAESEIQAADAVYRLDYYLPFGEADVSWARTLLAETPHQELDAYIDLLIAAGERWVEFKAGWFGWVGDFMERDLRGAAVDGNAALAAPTDPHEPPASFARVAPAEPQSECGRWLSAGEEFIELIDADWYRVADWYRGTARGAQSTYPGSRPSRDY